MTHTCTQYHYTWLGDVNSSNNAEVGSPLSLIHLGSAGLSPQCSTYSHRRRYSRQHSWSDDALLPLFSLLFFTTAMPLPKKKTLERRQKIKERRQAMEEAKKAKAEQQMATQVLMMLQRWGLFNPVKAFTRSANAVLLFYNEPPIKNYS